MAVTAALTLAALFAGCGSAEDPAVSGAPGAASAPAPVAQVNLPEACQTMGGTLLVSNGKELCKTFKFMNASWNGGYGLTYAPLTYSDPSGSQAIDLGIDVKKGDRFRFAGMAFWGEQNYQNVDLGWFGKLTTNWSWGGNPCAANNALGSSTGLLASDGTEVFTLQSNTNKVIQNDGRLKMGYNLPAPSASGKAMCTIPWIQTLYVEHCEDSSGTTQTCP